MECWSCMLYVLKNVRVMISDLYRLYLDNICIKFGHKVDIFVRYQV